MQGPLTRRNSRLVERIFKKRPPAATEENSRAADVQEMIKAFRKSRRKIKRF